MAKALAGSAGTKMKKAPRTGTNVVQHQERKDEEFTEDAYECFDKNGSQKYARKYGKDYRNTNSEPQWNRKLRHKEAPNHKETLEFIGKNIQGG